MSYQLQAEDEMWDAIASQDLAGLAERATLERDYRWFYVDAHTPAGVVFCGRVWESEENIRRTFAGCTIAADGTVSVWRAPNDTRESLSHLNGEVR